MNSNRLFLLSDRRRLVNLETRPLFQLKLPVLLLLISSLFLAVFLAHTQAAYGKLILAGFRNSYLTQLASEISYDYFVVSATLGVAWALCILGACLAMTHHYLGPIVALQRQIADLKRGEYSAPAHIRRGHPLRDVADELDGLAKLLSGEDLAVLQETDALPPLAALKSDASAQSDLDGGGEILAAEYVSGPAGDAETPHAATPWIGWYGREPAVAATPS